MMRFGQRVDSNTVFKCSIRLLKNADVLECEYRSYHKGKYILEYVCQKLSIVVQDYYGLHYVDISNQMHWLDLGELMHRVMHDLDPALVSFRVKYYPPNPLIVQEEITINQIFLQLKKDLVLGRLYCVTNEAAMLAALIIQGELGNYDPKLHLGNYISNFRIVLHQTEAIEQKAMEIHQHQIKGQNPLQVRNEFLKFACRLDAYGVDPQPVKDHNHSPLYLGINYSGIMTFQASQKTNHFLWAKIQKINYETNMFIIEVIHNEEEHTLTFECPTAAACKHIWKSSIEQKLYSIELACKSEG